MGCGVGVAGIGDGTGLGVVVGVGGIDVRVGSRKAVAAGLGTAVGAGFGPQQLRLRSTPKTVNMEKVTRKILILVDCWLQQRNPSLVPQFHCFLEFSTF